MKTILPKKFSILFSFLLIGMASGAIAFPGNPQPHPTPCPVGVSPIVVSDPNVVKEGETYQFTVTLAPMECTLGAEVMMYTYPAEHVELDMMPAEPDIDFDQIDPMEQIRSVTFRKPKDQDVTFRIPIHSDDISEQMEVLQVAVDLNDGTGWERVANFDLYIDDTTNQGAPLLGDLNGDSLVDPRDIPLFIFHMMTDSPPLELLAKIDMDRDLDIDFDDLILLLQAMTP